MGNNHQALFLLVDSGKEIVRKATAENPLGSRRDLHLNRIKKGLRNLKTK